MTSILRRAFATLRGWLGLNDPAEGRLHQAHGWLLPAVSLARGVHPKPAPRASSVPTGLRG